MNTVGAHDAGAEGSRRRRVIVLAAASVVVAALFGGATAGAVVKQHGAGPDHGRPSSRSRTPGRSTSGSRRGSSSSRTSRSRRSSCRAATTSCSRLPTARRISGSRLGARDDRAHERDPDHDDDDERGRGDVAGRQLAEHPRQGLELDPLACRPGGQDDRRQRAQGRRRGDDPGGAREAQIDPNSVKLLPVPFPAMRTALANGQVDAIWTPEPFLSQAINLDGARDLMAPGPVLGSTSPSAGTSPAPTGWPPTLTWRRGSARP